MIRPGDVLGDRYEVTALIAAGGMADVYLAHDPRLGRGVAVKVFRTGAGDAQRFESEIRMLSNLTHSNLVAVFDAGEHDGTPFVVLQHVEGHTLAQRFREGSLSVGEAARLGTEIGAALNYVHARRIVHRDIKPSNILIDGRGSALLADFGVAILLDATRLTMDGATTGTAAYLAPEQVGGGEVTSAADIYSLGLVLLEALTGKAAFTGTMHELITARVAREVEVPAEVGPGWSSLLTRMTRRDPALRPTAAEVTQAIPPASGGTRGLSEPDATRTAVAATPQRARVPSRIPVTTIAAVVILVAFVALAALGLVLSGGEDDPPSAPVDATTSTTAASTTTTAAPTTTLDRQALCAELERRKEETEPEKGRIERQHRDDEETRDRLKEDLEDERREIEADKKAAGC